MFNSKVWSNRSKLVLSAPGKVILHGDHSVVHGRRGVAMSLDLRTTLTLTPDNETVTLDLPDVKIRECWSINAVQRLYNMLGLGNCGRTTNKSNQEYPVLQPKDAQIIKEFLCISEDSESQRTHALLSFFHLYTSILPQPEGFTIFVESQLPTGAGLGSSAAYAACLSGALLVLSGKVVPETLVTTAEPGIRKDAQMMASKWAFTSEVIMHGKPSGIDNTTCSMGGVNSFKNGQTVSLEANGLQMMLVNTQVPRSTKALLQIVSDRLKKHPQVINPILDSMDAIAERSLVILDELRSLESNDETKALTNPALKSASLLKELGQLIDMNHSLLCCLGVSHPTLEKIMQVAKEHSLNAKLTGAGGGGFALILVPQNRKPEAFSQCMDALKALDCHVWMVDLGVPGLCLL